MLRRSVLAAGAFVALGAAPNPYAPGLSFIIKSSTTRDGKTTPPGPGTRVQALNGVLRFDSESGAGGKGGYVIVNPGAKTLSMVMPERKQYIEINFADSTGQALGVTASAMAATALISDIQVSGSSLGSGGSVNGYNTTRYRINTSFAEVPASGHGQRRVRMVEEFWVAGDLRDIPDPMEAFTRAFGGQSGMPQIGGTMGELMRKRGEAQRKLFTGLPIKSVVKSTFTERDGKTTEETSITEIVDLKRIDVDASAFRVPGGYTKMDMKSFMNIGAQIQNALKNAGSDMASSAKDGAKEAAQETKQETKDATKNAAKEKAKCALGGLLGKKC